MYPYRISALVGAVLTSLLLAFIAVTTGAPVMVFVCGGMALASFVLVAAVSA